MTLGRGEPRVVSSAPVGSHSEIVRGGGAKRRLTVRDRDPIPTAVEEICKVGQFDRLDLQPTSHA